MKGQQSFEVLAYSSHQKKTLILVYSQ